MVLVEVLVTALGGVEGEELGLALGGVVGGVDLLVRGVFEGVGDLRGFAEAADAGGEDAAGEEGADYGEEDKAAWRVSLGMGGGMMLVRSEGGWNGK